MAINRRKQVEGALILFLKFPEKGRVKTRLAAALGDDFTLGLYKAFVEDMLILSGSAGADTILAVDGPGSGAADSLDFGTGYPVVLQNGADIGERMANSFHQVFHAGYEKAVLIGGDLPDLPAAIVTQALGDLNSADAVIGRSLDGGYYLIGFRKGSFVPGCFRDIAWGTSVVFQQTMDLLKQAGRVSVLPDWNDIDDRDDLKRFYMEKLSGGDISSCTMRFLMDHISRKGIVL